MWDIQALRIWQVQEIKENIKHFFNIVYVGGVYSIFKKYLNLMEGNDFGGEHTI